MLEYVAPCLSWIPPWTDPGSMVFVRRYLFLASVLLTPFVDDPRLPGHLPPPHGSAILGVFFFSPPTGGLMKEASSSFLRPLHQNPLPLLRTLLEKRLVGDRETVQFQERPPLNLFCLCSPWRPKSAPDARDERGSMALLLRALTTAMGLLPSQLDEEADPGPRPAYKFN